MKTLYGLTQADLAQARKYIANEHHMLFGPAERWGYAMAQLKLTYKVNRMTIPYGSTGRPVAL